VITTTVGGRTVTAQQYEPLQAMRMSGRLALVLGKPALRLLQVAVSQWSTIRRMELPDSQAEAGAWAINAAPKLLELLGDDAVDVLEPLLSERADRLVLDLLRGATIDGVEFTHDAALTVFDSPWDLRLAAALLALERGLFPWPVGSSNASGQTPRTAPEASPAG
jgi:hypothetical protein